MQWQHVDEQSKLHIQKEYKNRCFHTQSPQLMTKVIMQDSRELSSFLIDQMNIQIGNNRYLPTWYKKQN